MEINPIESNSASLSTSIMLQKVETFRQRAVEVDQSENDATYTRAMSEISVFISGELALAGSDELTERVQKDRALAVFSHITTIDDLMGVQEEKKEAFGISENHYQTGQAQGA